MKIYFADLDKFTNEKLNDLCDLINRVYFITESVLIDPKISRITLSDLKEIIDKKELMVFELNGIIIGCVHIYITDETTAYFGMLVAHPNYREQGIGKKLIDAVEKWAKEKGCKRICLELLTPKGWIHEQKEFLRSWYVRSGYIKQNVVSFKKEVHLITPCDLTLYCKELI